MYNEHNGVMFKLNEFWSHNGAPVFNAVDVLHSRISSREV